MKKLHITWLTLAAAIVFVGLCGVVGYWVRHVVRASATEEAIVDFNDERDTQDILKIFERDRYWLLASPDYSPEYMLKYRAPDKEPRYLGCLTIKVWRQGKNFVGFTAYYMKSANLGFILFLAVNPEYRGKEKGYAEKLVRYALKALKDKGAQQAQLTTRVDNLRAQRLYKRVGFYPISEHDGFVYFAHDLSMP